MPPPAIAASRGEHEPTSVTPIVARWLMVAESGGARGRLEIIIASSSLKSSLHRHRCKAG